MVFMRSVRLSLNNNQPFYKLYAYMCVQACTIDIYLEERAAFRNMMKGFLKRFE